MHEGGLGQKAMRKICILLKRSAWVHPLNRLQHFSSANSEYDNTMDMLIDVQYLQITAVVGPAREKLDACLIFPSMPAVMKLNKLGTFSMAQLGQSKSIIGDFIKSARKVSTR